MAEKDQARLLRQISLTLTQFVMLQLEGALQTDTGIGTREKPERLPGTNG